MIGGFNMVKEGKKRIQITLNEKMLNKLEEISDEKGISKSAVVSLAIEKFE